VIAFKDFEFVPARDAAGKLIASAKSDEPTEE
jgi:hypothetical protein